MAQETNRLANNSHISNIIYNVLKNVQSHPIEKKQDIQSFNFQNLKKGEFLHRKVNRTNNSQDEANERSFKRKQDPIPSDSLTILPKEKIVYYNMERDHSMSSLKFKQPKYKMNSIVPCLPKIFTCF